MAKDFLTWAKSQAKQHGAASQISNLDKLKSPYSLQGFATWGDVIAGAQQDIEDAKKEAERKKATDAAKGSSKINAADAYEAQRESDPIYIQQQIDKWSGLATQWTAGSDHQTALDNLNKWQGKLDAVSNTQEQAGLAREAEAATKFTEQKLTKDQTDLQKLQAQLNVAKIKRENTADIQSKIDALTTKISGEKPTPQGPTVPAATGGLTPAPFGGMQNEQGAVQNVKGTQPGPLAPAGTGSSGAKGTSTTTTTATNTSGGGKYAMQNGVLNFNSQPFSGLYEGKYYSQGKIETPEQIKQDFFAKYAVQAALIASDPQLSELFTKAIDPKNNWSPEKWKLAFENSDWFNSHTSAQRNAEIQRLSSPINYTEQYNNAQKLLQQTATSLGIELTPAQLGSTIDPADAKKPHQLDPTGQDLAEWVVANNASQNPDALKAHLLQVGKINTTLTGGQVQGYAQQLKQTAMDLGLGNMVLPGSAGGDYFTDSAKAIISGTTDINKQTEYLRQQAIKMFPAYAKQIETGITVKSLAAPYINTLSNLMDNTITPDQLDLGQTTGYGAMITKALQGNNDPNNPIPMDLGTFQNQVRSLPQWMTTNNAKTTIMDSGTQFLKSMGLIR
jgi:hypothetical protein